MNHGIKNQQKLHPSGVRLQYVVAGTGRCGTKYMAAFLSAIGIRCGHEAVYGPHGIHYREGLVADSSYMSVPFLNEFSGKVIHIVRRPLDVVKSFVGIGFFSRDLDMPFRKWAWEYFERSGDPVIDAMRWWVDWNKRIEPYASIRVRIEDMPDYGLLSFLGKTQIPQIPPNINHRKRSKLTRLPEGEVKEELKDLARQYGY